MTLGEPPAPRGAFASFAVGFVLGLVAGVLLVSSTGCGGDDAPAPSCPPVDAGPSCSSVCRTRADFHCDDVDCYCDTDDGPVCCRGDL